MSSIIIQNFGAIKTLNAPVEIKEVWSISSAL